MEDNRQTTPFDRNVRIQGCTYWFQDQKVITGVKELLAEDGGANVGINQG